MKIRAAVLDKMGAEPPYAKSKPLRIAELDLDPPGRGELLVRVVAAGSDAQAMLTSLGLDPH